MQPVDGAATAIDDNGSNHVDTARLLPQVVEYLDEYLAIRDCEDSPNALNGLQLENSGKITKIGAAVDASGRSITAASKRGIDFLLVHHGIFWPGLRPIVGAFREQIRIALEHGLAIYSAHLPLDVHPELGNNALLAAALGLREIEPFFAVKGRPIGLRARSSGSIHELVRKLEHSLGSSVKFFASGPEEPKNVGLITGGAGSEIYGVAREGIDTFITGEGPHWAAVAAGELGMNLLLGGHYATETFGVKALAAHLSERFELPWEFIDHPTGL
ncbi:MAG: Nif3-like dinuclear metal center hexameric protein [Chthoniobacterales bacterium]